MLTLILTALCWTLLIYQRRQIQRFKDIGERIQKEKEAVLSLMDIIGERTTRTLDVEETLDIIAQYVVEETRAESGAIFLLDDVEHTLQARVVVGLFPPLFDDVEVSISGNKYQADVIRKHKIKAGEGLIGSMLKREKPLLITDAEADPRVPRLASKAFSVHTMVLCPMRVRGRELGVIVIVNKQGEAIFNSHDMFLLQALADQAAITVDIVKLYDVLARQQKLEQELNIAREFQRMLLPRKLPQVPGFEFSALNNSALSVGGDFYDFFHIDSDHLAIVIGDVSGKGIPGALIMTMVRSTIRAEARETYSPKEVLRRVNERVLADTKESVFVTMTYGILDFSTRRFRFARAGHEPTLLRRGSDAAEISVLQPEGMALGLVPSEVFNIIEDMELQLDPGDTVLLYTDGVVEAVNMDSEEYSRQRLIEDFARHAELPAAELIDVISGDISRFAHGIPQHDDITLVAFTVTAAEDQSGQEGEVKADPGPAEQRRPHIEEA